MSIAEKIWILRVFHNSQDTDKRIVVLSDQRLTIN